MWCLKNRVQKFSTYCTYLIFNENDLWKPLLKQDTIEELQDYLVKMALTLEV